MKAYIIAGLLFATALLVLGVLTADLMGPPAPKPQARPVQDQASRGSSTPSGAAASSYTATMPKAGAAGTSSTTPGGAGHDTNTLGALPGLGTLPGSAGPSGMAGTIGVSAPPAIPVPRPPSDDAPPSVPIIQPTDLGSAPTPTAGKSHQ